MNLLEEVQKIEAEIKKTKSFQKLSELFANIEKKCRENEAEYDEKVFTYVISSHALAISNFRNFCRDWEAGGIPKYEQLENAEKLLKIISSNLSKFGEEEFPEKIFGKNYLSESEKFLKTLQNKIEEEKSHRQNFPQQKGDNNKPVNNGGGNQTPSHSELENQIKILEDKLKNTPNSDINKKQLQQELERLKIDLKEKKQPQHSNKENNFPTGLVVGGGVIIIVLLLVIVFLVRKKRN
jgi:hypothetical protein